MSEEVVLSFGGEEEKKRTVKHPIAVFFHVLFRTLSILLYVFASYIFSNGFVELFIIIILLLALDFWVIKNITGRLLVGLRWWNKVEEDGTSTWVFETKKSAPSAGAEVLIFWSTLICFPILWIVFFFTAALKLAWMWMLIPAVGIALNSANVIGYFKCRKDAGTKLRNMAGQFIGQQLLKQALNTTTQPQT